MPTFLSEFNARPARLVANAGRFLVSAFSGSNLRTSFPPVGCDQLGGGGAVVGSLYALGRTAAVAPDVPSLFVNQIVNAPFVLTDFR